MATEYEVVDASPPSVGNMASAQRAFELRKVFAPELLQNHALERQFDEELNADRALDAFAETVVWRLKAAHVMISLVDRGVQYFLAGAQREPSKKAINDDEEDDEEVVTQRKWFGCSSVDIPGGLCENTIALKPSAEQYPTFIIPDLSQDDRFKDLPVVNGVAASYRFYAGTPITTNQGTNIGSLFVFDTKPRKGITHKQRVFLHSQASNVMRHLMTKREATEKRRAALMSEGIAKFLDMTAEYRAVDEETEIPKDMQPEPAKPLPEHTGEQDATLTESPAIKDFPAQSSVLEKIRRTLDQAAEILRESLEITTGGVVFLDTTLANTEVIKLSKAKAHARPHPWSNQASSRECIDRESPDLLSRPSKTLKRSSTDKNNKPKILAASIPKSANWDSRSSSLNSQTLANLIAYHNKGNVWSIDEEGAFSSFREIDTWEKLGLNTPEERLQSLTPENVRRSQYEAMVLSEIFPKARQIVFLPLWDAGSNRWYSGTFIWSQASTPVFTVNSELTYLSSFTNSMMVEISRLDAVTANKMKSDFLGSISHEFRSPLHGILVSAEFLRDSRLDSIQSELVGTIQSCSGTLLDTINHVLDYSKINSFEIAGNQEEPSTSQLYQVTNLALLCETAIEGLIAATVFRENSLEDVSLAIAENTTPLERQMAPEIILDIEDRDWNFKVEAGALQRIIMNLAGNAQKFTSQGHIIISMSISEQQSSNEDTSTATLLFRITDTGKGISPDFMERKLYSPFSQEDSFVPGVGLGLSIVWSIVNQMGGSIEMKSEVGKGTDVQVSLEVLPVQPPPESSRRTIEAALPDAELLLAKLRDRAAGKTFDVLKRDTSTSSHQLDLSWTLLERYLAGWFGFKFSSSSADIIVTNDSSDYRPNHTQRTLLIDEDSNRTLHRKSDALMVINHPFGPFKLARALLALLDRDIPQEDAGTPRAISTEAGTQTPLGSPAEREIMNGIILSDYNFPSSSNPADVVLNDQASARSTKLVDEIPSAQCPAPVNDIDLKLPERLKVRPKAKVSAAVSFKDQQEPITGETRETIKSPSAKSMVTDVQKSASLKSSMSKTGPKNTSDTQKRALRILAVDDNAVNLQLLHRYLQKRKQDIIVTATDGVEAVEKVKKSVPFDIVFMDISMPNMDGFEATRLIRSFERAQLHRSTSDYEKECGSKPPSPATTPSQERDCELVIDEQINAGRAEPVGHGRAFVVALTGLASRRDRDEAQQSGFDDFLTKPISFRRIGELLDRLSWEK